MEKKFNQNYIIVAYEPIWSIGTGKVPNSENLKRTAIYIKKIVKNLFKTRKNIPILYGGSIDGKLIKNFLSL